MSWDVKPTVFAADIDSDIAGLRTRIALEIHSAIVLRSPVDTGRLRASTFITYGAPANNTVGRTGDASSAIARGLSELSSRADSANEVVYLSNALPYAEKIESGTGSRQAPDGFWAISFESIAQKYRG